MSNLPDAIARWIGGLWAAVGFLTVISVPEQRAEHGLGGATLFFPVVGVALGICAALIAQVPLSPSLAALLAVAFMWAITGGLHWDGWADVLDAAVTPAMDPERRLGILSDPRVGAHAAVGVALLALACTSALMRAPFWGVVLGSAMGRWVMVATLRWAPALRSDGAAATLRDGARPAGGATILLALVLGLATRGNMALPGILIVLGTGAATATLFALFLVRRLGGMNGDAHGAVGLLTEVVVWAAAAELQSVSI